MWIAGPGLKSRFQKNRLIICQLKYASHAPAGGFLSVGPRPQQANHE